MENAKVRKAKKWVESYKKLEEVFKGFTEYSKSCLKENEWAGLKVENEDSNSICFSGLGITILATWALVIFKEELAYGKITFERVVDELNRDLICTKYFEHKGNVGNMKNDKFEAIKSYYLGSNNEGEKKKRYESIFRDLLVHIFELDCFKEEF